MHVTGMRFSKLKCLSSLKAILFDRITHLQDPTIRNMSVMCLYGNAEFHIPFWSMIYVALEFKGTNVTHLIG